MRASSGTTIVIFVVSGRIIGLKDNEWGQIGVSEMTLELGCTMDPPHDRLYAVLPVGVEINAPSPWTLVSRSSLM